MQDWKKNKEAYRTFCKKNPELPVFLTDWWLDTVCEKGSWEVCLSKDKNGIIQGVLPFHITRYMGIKVNIMPPLTPYLGVWLKYPKNLKKEYKKRSFEKRVYSNLISQLPKTAYYAQNHPIQLNNWLPFYWKGFKQTIRYTYRIENPINLVSTYSYFKSNVRNKILKAKKKLEIIESDDIELFYAINQLTFHRQSKKVPYSLEFIIKIDKVLYSRKQRKILLAKDQNNQIHAGIYLVWDAKTVYNLMLGADTELRNSGAVQLLLWTGIQLASKKNCTFDFEGSMMPNIEAMFRSFGGKLTPYSKIYKAGNYFFRLLNSIRTS